MSQFLETMRRHVLKRVEIMDQKEEVLNTLDFCQTLLSPFVIAEVKFASPAKGLIYKGGLDHVAIARQYVAAGACALSILTEPDFFKGSIDYLADIRQALPNTPLLLKDFVLSTVQIREAAFYGANAVLLIVAFLDDATLRDLYVYARSLNLTPLIEVHDEAEIERALLLSPKMIGVNNRNLQTLAIDLEHSRRLIARIPKNTIAICESGIESALQMDEMSLLGFDGFLIGGRLMQTAAPGEALRELLHAR